MAVGKFLDSSFNLLDDRINIEGYNILRADHPNDNKRGGGGGGGGGVADVYFKKHLPILRCDDLCIRIRTKK